MKHDLLDLIESQSHQLASDYKRIRRRALEDPGTAGDASEEGWAQFLRDWLPGNYHVVTKGRILDSSGDASPQVDLVILRPGYPKAWLNGKLYDVNGVLAAFECKLTLRPDHIRKAFKTAEFVKNLRLPRYGDVHGELCQSPIYGVLAHSQQCCKKGNHSDVLRQIREAQSHLTDHPRDTPDVICIADTAMVLVRKSIELGNPEHSTKSRKTSRSDSHVGVGFYVYPPSGKRESSSADILSLLIYDLTRRLSFEDPSIQPFADYLGQLRSWPITGSLQLWPTDVLSAPVVCRLLKYGIDNGPWSRWADRY